MSLQITTTDSAGALAPEQKRFNTLTKQIAEAREALAMWQGQRDAYHDAHAKQLRPLFRARDQAARDWVFRLDGLLADERWSQQDEDFLRTLLLNQLRELIDAQDPPDARLKSLFNLHSPVDHDAEQREVRQAMQREVEARTGLDLGEAPPDETDEAFFARVQQQLEAQQADAEAQAAAAAEARAQAQAGRRKRAAREREAAEAQDATLSVREVFRKLASALHPDREPDPAERERKTQLMQQVNVAYAANDLLALLTLQLQLEQIDAEHLARADAAHLRRYCRVLAEQLAELKLAIGEAEARFADEAGLDSTWGWRPARLKPLLKAQARQLQDEINRLQEEVRLLESGDDARRWLKAVRRYGRSLLD